MAGLFLPQKQDYEVQYSLETPGTFTWTAPDAENAGGGDQYEITIQMWGAGSGGAASSTSFYPGGYGGGSGGAYSIAVVKVLAGTVYTFSVGNGGAAAGGFGNPSGGFQGFPSSGYAGGAGGNTRIADGSGAIITAAGGASQGYNSTQKDYPTSGNGGSTIIGQAGKVTSYSNVSGAKGGSGLRQPGTSVLAQLGEPGGAGGAAGAGNTFNNRVGCGGGASVRANGGNGGTSGGSNSSNAGGTGSGGGGGYHAGANGVNGATGGGSSSVNSSFTAGGRGGDGRLTFSFMVSNGGSPGIAPA